jgi:hypothetical protein
MLAAALATLAAALAILAAGLAILVVALATHGMCSYLRYLQRCGQHARDARRARIRTILDRRCVRRARPGASAQLALPHDCRAQLAAIQAALVCTVHRSAFLVLQAQLVPLARRCTRRACQGRIRLQAAGRVLCVRLGSSLSSLGAQHVRAALQACFASRGRAARNSV